MSTTHLFVELIVTGLGAFVWLALAALSAFGYEWVRLEEVPLTAAALPLICFIYALGIVADRIADASFDVLWGKRLRARWFPDAGDYYNAYNRIFTGSERFAELHNYGRSRLRVCRGWAMNAALVAVTANVFIWTRLPDAGLRPRLSAFVTAVAIVMAVLSWWAWKKLTVSEYLKTQKQVQFLSEQEKTSA